MRDPASVTLRVGALRSVSLGAVAARVGAAFGVKPSLHTLYAHH